MPSENYCERCGEPCAEYAHKDDLWCQSCVEARNEAAYDRYMDRMVSGGIGYGARGEYIPLRGGSVSRLKARWDEESAQWDRGFRDDWEGGWKAKDQSHDGMSFADWHGERPDPDDYMPDWEDQERTHLQMYEDTSEGTPISPVMETAEELARWLADNGASAFGKMTATYEQWLATIHRGSAPSMIFDGRTLESGVAAMGRK